MLLSGVKVLPFFRPNQSEMTETSVFTMFETICCVLIPFVKFFQAPGKVQAGARKFLHLRKTVGAARKPSPLSEQSMMRRKYVDQTFYHKAIES